MFRSIIRFFWFGWQQQRCLARARLNAIAFRDFKAERNVRIGPGCRIRPTDTGLVWLKENVIFERDIYIVASGASMVIEANSFVGTGVVICARSGIEIGASALIAEYVTIRDQDHEFETLGETRNAGMRSSAIRIGNNVWIGAKATITRGVVIGDNAVIGANAVVTKNIPANAVAAGIPARVIRMIDRK